MAERCDARTVHRNGRATHQVRCDLNAGHEGRHELRMRSTGELVKSWTTDTEGQD